MPSFFVSFLSVDWFNLSVPLVAFVIFVFIFGWLFMWL